jgi:hypothetical protein
MLSALSLQAQEPNLDLPAEPPPIETIDGVPYVLTPVEFLRNALWYYDNYFIQRDLAATRGDLLTDCQTNYGECVDDLSARAGEIATLERKLGTWRGATISVSVVAVTGILIMAVVP